MSVVRSLSFCAVLLALTMVALCTTPTPEEQKAKGDAFIKWAKENGATVNNLRVSPDPRFGGFSIVASKSIHEGEEILRIPASKLIISRRSIIAWIEEIKKQQNPSDESSSSSSSSSNGLVSPPSLATLTSLETASPEALGFLASMVPVVDEISNRINNDAHIFSFYILFHRFLGTKSPLYHWIQILPAQINSPLFFNDDDFSQLIGSDVHAKTLVLKNQTETFWKESLIPALKEKLESSTFTEDSEAFINQNYDLDSWRWAMSTVASRTVLYNSTIQIPLVYDFFNHLPQPPTKKPKLAIDRNGDFSVSTQRPYITGQQVFVDYGPLPISHLLLFYGFALEDNKKRDSVAFHFTLDPEDPLRSEKETLLTSNNLRSDLFLLFQEQMSMEVQFYARVRVADSIDLETIKKDIRSVFQKPISIINERNAMSYIDTVAQSLIDRFPTDYKSDIEALAKPEGEIPRNGRNAILVRKVEKHILLRTHNTASGAVSSIDDAIKAQQAKLDTVDAPPVDQADIVL